ncbi:MAG: YeeE/YedE family protein [Methanomicrobiales archaeon]|nr:YeeE/YedE family protein [Methanomicrobiales archaeon]
MIEYLMEPQWSPYVAGAGIGILLWLSFLFSNKPLGCSTAFSRISGMIEFRLLKKTVDDKEYYRIFPPETDWQVMMVMGIVIGAFLSSVLSGTFHITLIPETFSYAFGDNFLFRLIIALIGGIFMGLGARWSWGCTSGHGISGLSQLSLASLVAVLGFFIAGISTAMILYSL